MYYKPSDDSILLLNSSLKILKDLNRKNLNILEVGVGSGFVISNIAKKYPKNYFYGTDINKYALEKTKEEFKKVNKNNKSINSQKIKITLKNCNLIGFRKKFDIIIFNPPYLPLEDNEILEDLDLESKALYGGKKGNEITIEFLNKLERYLNIDGIALIILSTLSKPEEVFSYLKNNLYNYEILGKKKLAFEELLVVKINKNNLRKKLEKLKVKDIFYYTKGKHSVIYKGRYKNKEVIIKKGLREYITKEFYFLKKLEENKFKNSPKIYYFEEEFIIIEFIKGETIENFLLNCKNKKEVIDVLNKILEITYKLDKLNINKFELNHPYKHIIIKFNNKNKKIKFIDFERSIFSENPKNTRQFLQYIISKKILNILNELNITISKKKVLKIGKELKNKKFKVKIEQLI